MSALNQYYIRMAQPRDAERCRELDVMSWGEESAASVEMLRSRIEIYPAGNYVAVHKPTGIVVCSVWSLCLANDKVDTWWDSTGEGAYTGKNVSHGPVQLGVNACVDPAHEGSGIAAELLIHGVGLNWDLGKREFVMGCRIPEYHKWKNVFTPEVYVHLLKHGGITYYRDPSNGDLRVGLKLVELSTDSAPIDPRKDWSLAPANVASATPFDGEQAYFSGAIVRGVPCKTVRVLPGYFPDPDSLDNGVLLRWKNPRYEDM